MRQVRYTLVTVSLCRALITITRPRAENTEQAPDFAMLRSDVICRHVLEPTLDVIKGLANHKNSKSLPLSTAHITTELI